MLNTTMSALNSICGENAAAHSFSTDAWPVDKPGTYTDANIHKLPQPATARASKRVCFCTGFFAMACTLVARKIRKSGWFPDHTGCPGWNSSAREAQDLAYGSRCRTINTVGVGSIARRNRYQ